MPDVALGEETEAEAEGRPIEIEEEMRKPRVGARPVQPARAEVAEHYPLHLNYKSWCDHAVLGRHVWRCTCASRQTVRGL